MKQWLLMTGLAWAVVGCAPRFSGQLEDPVGKPVASDEARVNITNLKTGVSRRSVVVPVNPEGVFVTSADLGQGPFLVEALVPGYLVSSQRVESLAGDGFKIVLRPIEAPETKAIGINIDGNVGRASGGATIMPPNL